jgi:hypothetical protein
VTFHRFLCRYGVVRHARRTRGLWLCHLLPHRPRDRRAHRGLHAGDEGARQHRGLSRIVALHHRSSASCGVLTNTFGASALHWERQCDRTPGNTCASFDRTGRWLLVTRYWESGISVLPWDPGEKDARPTSVSAYQLASQPMCPTSAQHWPRSWGSFSTL